MLRGCPTSLIRLENCRASALSLASYHKKDEGKEEVKGHNHPASEKCGQYCPRNEHYKGPKKRFDIRHRNK